MNFMLQECYQHFAKTCPDGKPTLVHWVTEVGKIDGGTKQKRLEALLEFGIDPMNDSERKSLEDLEKEGLVLSIQSTVGERYSISMLGLVHVLRSEPDWLADECVSELAKLMTADIKKTLPQKQKLTPQEICILFFLLICSRNDGKLDLQEDDRAEKCWSLFKNNFLNVICKYEKGNAIEKVIKKIESKSKKHTSMRAFMLNLEYLTSTKILVAQNHTYSFKTNQDPTEYLPRLFLMSDLKHDFRARQELAEELTDLRYLAALRSIVEDPESEFFSRAIDGIKDLA